MKDNPSFEEEVVLSGFNTSSTFDSQSFMRGLIFSSRLQPRLLLWIRTCYHGYGHGFVIERPISAHAHIQKC